MDIQTTNIEIVTSSTIEHHFGQLFKANNSEAKFTDDGLSMSFIIPKHDFTESYHNTMWNEIRAEDIIDYDVDIRCSNDKTKQSVCISLLLPLNYLSHRYFYEGEKLQVINENMLLVERQNDALCGREVIPDPLKQKIKESIKKNGISLEGKDVYVENGSNGKYICTLVTRETKEEEVIKVRFSDMGYVMLF